MFLVIFLISAVVVTNYFLESKKQEAVFQALEHIAEQETGSTSDKVDSSEEVRGPENSEYDTLSERNPDNQYNFLGSDCNWKSCVNHCTL